MDITDILLQLLMGACVVIAALAKNQAGQMQRQIDGLIARLDALQEEHEVEIVENARLKVFEQQLMHCPVQHCHWRQQHKPNA